MCENVNINVSETNETINIVSSEIQEVIDINVFENTEDVTLNITEQLIQVNINKVTGGGGEETLAQTLVFGNNTGGTNILLNSTDSILLENNSSLRKGTYDFGQGGGISRICGVDYEDMWQGGIRHVFDNNGFIRNSTNCFNVVPNNTFDVTLRFKVGSIWTLDDGTNYICTDATEGAAVWELYNEIPTNTSDLTNDGEDGVNPFITAADLPSLTGYVPYTGATQDVDLGEFEIKAGQVEFDQTPTGTAGVGVMRWNDSDGTVDLGLKGGNVTLQIGQEQVLRVVNKTATNVNLLEANYQAVRVTGAQGQRLKVDLAQATNDTLSAETIGLVTETINNNQEGFITTSGLVRGINTTGSLQGETWADGDILYLSPTTAGRATKVKPTAPNHLIVLGYVIHAHITQGSIFVKVDNGYELDELHNVKITSAANNNVLAYTSATDVWENKTVETALGFTPVTNARTISTSAPLSGGGDLTANRTLSITQATTSTDGYLSSTNWNTFNNKFTLPSLTSGSVLFSNGTTIAQDNSNLFWDDTNNRLGIGTNAPLLGLDTRGGFNLYTSLGSHYLTSFSTSSSDSTLLFTRTAQNGIYRFKLGGSGGGGLELTTDFNTGECKFNAQGGGFFPTIYSNGVERMRIPTTGNVLLNTTTDAGFKLDVNGTARVQNVLTVTKGAGNYFTLDAGADGSNLTLRFFKSGVYDNLLSTRNLTLVGGFGIGDGLGLNGGFLATTVGSSSGLLAVTHTSSNAQVHIASPAGFSSYVSFRENGIANRGIIGYQNNTSYFQIRVNDATSMTTGTMSTAFFSSGSVGINTTTEIASSQLTVESTTKGFLPPRMTTTQKNAIATPAAGLVVYDTTLNKLCV